ncbi:thioredoxin H-type-like [Camellia sinensis]|uniref:thioredoxin H-type-like n=1 Tax=Camellia sinensis TaxID=4442 RepID=UPI00103597F0|nr:thioredoxin H-type-like [Camellia sinensis]
MSMTRILCSTSYFKNSSHLKLLYSPLSSILYKELSHQLSNSKPKTFCQKIKFSDNNKRELRSKFQFPSTMQHVRRSSSTSSLGSMQTSSMRTSQVLAFHSPSKWKTHFEASKATSKLMVIYFTASWCVPCRFMEPAIDEFAAKYTEVEFIKIDVDELMDVSQEYGVQAMPTFILIKKGRVVDKVTGVRKEELQNKIEKNRAYHYCS